MNYLRCHLGYCEVLEVVFYYVMEIPTHAAVTKGEVLQWVN